ncbi:hypothetical protein AX15_005150 [Amanita polypyramis BW_CC]|nr:hypothetical protein AX15_005150 [Amanita polypyramis BW_CC]
MSTLRVLSVIVCLVGISEAFPMKRSPAAAVIEHCTVPNTVALTFDDGPWIYAENVSDTLTAAGAVGTFFYSKYKYDCIYNSDEISRVQYVYAHGHQIASHTWSHPDLTTLSHDEINSQMDMIEQAIHRITGAYPAFTRPPFGSYNDLVLQVAQERGQKFVTWDFDSGDSVGASVAQQEATYDQTIIQHPSTILALNHETYETTVTQTLPYALQKLKRAGYRLVSLAECLGEQPYKYVDQPGTPDSTWHC